MLQQPQSSVAVGTLAFPLVPGHLQFVWSEKHPKLNGNRDLGKASQLFRLRKHNGSGLICTARVVRNVSTDI